MNTYQNEREYREPDEIQIPSKDGFIVIPTYSLRAEKVEEPARQRAKSKVKKNGVSLKGSILQLAMALTVMGVLLSIAGLAAGEIIGVLSLGFVGGTGLLTFKSGIDRIKELKKKQATNLNWDL